MSLNAESKTHAAIFESYQNVQTQGIGAFHQVYQHVSLQVLQVERFSMLAYLVSLTLQSCKYEIVPKNQKTTQNE